MFAVSDEAAESKDNPCLSAKSRLTKLSSKRSNLSTPRKAIINCIRMQQDNIYKFSTDNIRPETTLQRRNFNASSRSNLKVGNHPLQQQPTYALLATETVDPYFSFIVCQFVLTNMVHSDTIEWIDSIAYYEYVSHCLRHGELAAFCTAIFSSSRQLSLNDFEF